MAKKIVFASGKGGVGKSSAALGISASLAANGFNVLLADFDIGLRSLDLMLGVSEGVVFDWGDIILGRCDAQQAVIQTQSLSFLAAPGSFDPAFTEQSVREMFITVFDDAFDFIIFDAPAGLGRGFSLACAAADSACLVTTADNVCVRSCAAAAAQLRKSKTELRLIINRFEEKPVVKGKMLNLDDCIDAVAVRLLGVLPEDEAVTVSSVTGKAPSKNSPFSLACRRISLRLLGERLPLFTDM